MSDLWIERLKDGWAVYPKRPGDKPEWHVVARSPLTNKAIVEIPETLVRNTQHRRLVEEVIDEALQLINLPFDCGCGEPVAFAGALCCEDCGE